MSTSKFKAPLQEDGTLPPSQAQLPSTPLRFAPVSLHLLIPVLEGAHPLAIPSPFSWPGKLLPMTQPSKPNSKHLLLWEVLLTSSETY